MPCIAARGWCLVSIVAVVETGHAGCWHQYTLGSRRAYHVCDTPVQELRHGGIQLAQLVAATVWMQQVILDQLEACAAL